MRARTIGSSVLFAVLLLLAATACGGEAVSPTDQRSGTGSALVEPADAPAGAALYRADWSAGADGWSTSEDWTVQRGELLCVGQDFSLEVGAVAPIELDDGHDFAAEAEIRLLRYTVSNGSFGVMVRVQADSSGYSAGHHASDDLVVLRAQPGGRPTLDSQPFTPGDGWHRYRVEVRGNELRAFIDGAPVLSATDNTFLTGKRVGLWSRGAQVSVRGFEVSALQG